MGDRTSRAMQAAQTLPEPERTGLGFVIVQSSIVGGLMVDSIFRTPDEFLLASEVALGLATLLLVLAILRRAGAKVGGLLVLLELVLPVVLLVRLGLQWSDDRANTKVRVAVTAFTAGATILGFRAIDGIAKGIALRRKAGTSHGSREAPPGWPGHVPPVAAYGQGGYPPGAELGNPRPAPWAWRPLGAAVSAAAVVALVVAVALVGTSVRNDPTRAFRREAGYACVVSPIKPSAGLDRLQLRAAIDLEELKVQRVEDRLRRLDPPPDYQAGWDAALLSLHRAHSEFEQALDDLANEHQREVDADLLRVVADLHVLTAYGDRHHLTRCGTRPT